MSDKASTPNPTESQWGNYDARNMLDIFVGSAKRRFSVSRQLLKAKSIVFNANSRIKCNGRSVCLPDADPVAFNMFVAWLQGVALPKVRVLDNGFDTSKFSPANILEGYLGSVPVAQAMTFKGFKTNIPMEDTFVAFQSITFHVMFRAYSADEIHLAAMMRREHAENPGSNLSLKPPIKNNSIVDAAQSPFANQRKVEDNENGSDHSYFPANPQQNDFYKNQTKQSGLLKLAIFAERFGFEDCFNETITAYRKGEGLLA